MKKSGKRDDEYPAVHSWNYITVEGYCMLNMEFGMFKDRYICELKTDGSFKRKKNDRYDPTKKPDSYPKDAPAPSGQYVSSVSILHGAIRIIPDEQQKASGPG